VNAAEQARLIERKRRDREDELLLLLLLLCDDARRDTAVMLAHGKSYADVIANDLAPGVNAIARTAALAHADAYRRFGKIAGVTVPRDAAGPLDVLARQYEPGARAAVDAMTQSLTQAVADITAKFPDESPKLLAKSAFDNAGYTKDKPHNLDFGAERAIVLASNVGMLQAARQVSDAERRGGVELPTRQMIGLRHHSVIDDRTTDICLDRHNLTLPVDDPFWFFNVPPLHPRCRSILLPVVGAYEADTVLPSVPPAPGWGLFPQGFFAQFGLAA
jgi:uncharacterized protein with PIN domain